jgi:hypothetical protein
MSSHRTSIIGVSEKFPKSHKWHNEDTIKKFFSSLPVSRAVNPHLYDSKVEFWKEILENSVSLSFLSESKVFLFASPSLPNVFIKNGIKPLCLNDVLVSHLITLEGSPF